MSDIESRGGRYRIRPAGKRMEKPQSKSSNSGTVREAIFGLNDGLVATIGLVSGEALSHQPRGSIVIAGLSAIGAAMVSMAVGSYLATSSENDFMNKEIRQQEKAIREHPKREHHHVRHLLKEIGVPTQTVGDTAANIVASRPRWLKFMIRENLGIHQNRAEKPLKNSLVMAVAVIVGSAPPVIPYLLPLRLTMARDISWAVAVAAALVLGGVKGLLTETSVAKSSVAFGVLVSLSALVGALIGYGLGVAGA